jgi:hypothetical protein
VIQWVRLTPSPLSTPSGAKQFLAHRGSADYQETSSAGPPLLIVNPGRYFCPWGPKTGNIFNYFLLHAKVFACRPIIARKVIKTQ